MERSHTGLRKPFVTAAASHCPTGLSVDGMACYTVTAHPTFRVTIRDTIGIPRCPVSSLIKFFVLQTALSFIS